MTKIIMEWFSVTGGGLHQRLWHTDGGGSNHPLSVSEETEVKQEEMVRVDCQHPDHPC